MPAASALRPDRHLQRALRRSALGLALSGLFCPPALAVEAAPLNATALHTYQIPAGPLGATLSRFAVDAGIALSFQPALTAGLNSPAVVGEYSVQAAINRLLEGSGLGMLLRSDGSYTLVQRRITLDETTVTSTGKRADPLTTEYAGGQVATGARLGVLGNTDVMDAPFSVSTWTSALVRDQQAVTVGDLLERDASVRSTGQKGGIVDSFFIRGFPVAEGNLGELAFDGVYGVAPNYRVFTDYAERIELLKGPGALLYGMSPNSAVGGVINVVPKRALEQDLTRLVARYAQDAQIGGHLDVSRRLGEERRFGVRLNASTQQGDTAIENQARDIDIGAIALDYQGERLRASLDWLSQQERIDAASRPFLIAPGLDVPAAANGRVNVSQAWGWSRTRDQSALFTGEYDLSDTLILFAHTGGGTSAVARLSDQTPTIINAAGDTSSIPGYYRFEVERHTVDAGLRLRLDTGPVSHRTTLQVSRYRDELSRGIVTGAPVLSNIDHPIERARPWLQRPDTPKVSASELTGVALADTLSVLDERLQVTLGVRQQRIESYNYDANGRLNSPHDDGRTTPLFGLLLKPWDQVSLYYNYIQGLSKGDIAPSAATNAGEIFAPYLSRQHELGIKADYGAFTTSVALFQITKPSGELASGMFSVQGEQRNRGLELNVFGEMAPGMRLLGGVTLLDAELTRTATPANRGHAPVGVPHIQANLWAEWDTSWIEGLTLSGGAIHTGSQYVDQANTQQLAAWTRLDAGARYTLRLAERPTTFRVMVQNVLDQAYWSGVASYGAFSQGAPRSVSVSATVDF
ncbi:TonB-dependent receptor [Pseudomonas ovata]|uniref:TonB-dependent receptor n=1 Tax=Pseudomonas ovata TaxID=1839709 RepID=UPI000D68EA9C|nr:TonB-dependent receptor [Pseudomonas ovata]